MKRLFVYIVGILGKWDLFPDRLMDILMWPIATRVLGKKYRQRVFLKDGFYMYGSMEDILSRKILFEGPWKRNLWEPITSEKLERLSEKSKRILIAGSHMGYMVLKAALRTSGKVHAFEPVPALFEMSKANFELNPELEKKIHLTRAALGEKEGTIELYVEDIRSSAIAYSGGHVVHNRKVSVPLTTVDSYAEKHGAEIDLILLDIEGFEWYALNGAKNTLLKKPELILEISPKILSHTEITPEMMRQRVKEMGYTTITLDEDPDYVNIYATVEAS